MYLKGPIYYARKSFCSKLVIIVWAHSFYVSPNIHVLYKVYVKLHTHVQIKNIYIDHGFKWSSINSSLNA